MVFMPNITTNHAITYSNSHMQRFMAPLLQKVHFNTMRRYAANKYLEKV